MPLPGPAGSPPTTSIMTDLGREGSQLPPASTPSNSSRGRRTPPWRAALVGLPRPACSGGCPASDFPIAQRLTIVEAFASASPSFGDITLQWSTSSPRIPTTAKALCATRSCGRRCSLSSPESPAFRRCRSILRFAGRSSRLGSTSGWNFARHRLIGHSRNCLCTLSFKDDKLHQVIIQRRENNQVLGLVLLRSLMRKPWPADSALCRPVAVPESCNDCSLVIQPLRRQGSHQCASTGK